MNTTCDSKSATCPTISKCVKGQFECEDGRCVEERLLCANV